MFGEPWANVVRGANELINFMKGDHKDHKNVQIVIIFFNSNARLIYDEPLSNPMGNIFNFGSGFTEFGPPIIMGMQKI